MLTKKDILRISQIEERDIDPKAIGSCFGLVDPRDERCYIKGNGTCVFSKSCLIYCAELLEIDYEGVKPIDLLSKILKMWEMYENKKLDGKLKVKLDERIALTAQGEKAEIEEGVVEELYTNNKVKPVEDGPSTSPVKESVKAIGKKVVKDVKNLEPNSKKGTALYYAEEFWLKEGGTEEECVKYVEEKIGKPGKGKLAVGTIKANGKYPYRMLEIETGKFKLVPIDWM